jgi:hypothetical protein
VAAPRPTAESPAGAVAQDDRKEQAAAEGSGAYRVDLADRPARAAPAETGGARVTSYDGELSAERQRVQSLGKLAQGTSDGAPAKPQKRAAGIELRTPEPQPKDLYGTQLAQKPRAKKEGRRASDDDASSPMDQVAQTRSAPSGAGGASAQAQAAPPPPQAAPQAPVITALGGQGNAVNGPSYRLDSKDNAPSQTAPAAPAARPADEKQSDGPAQLDWARKRRIQVIDAVRAGECRKAAAAAAEIYNRAPEFYITNIANDREIRPCKPYLPDEKQLVERQRAAKRANAVESAPPQAASPPRK